MKLHGIAIFGTACGLFMSAGEPLRGQIVSPPTPAVVPPELVSPPPAVERAPAPAPSEIPEEKPREFNASPMVRVDVLMISASEEKLLPLLPQLRDPAQIEGAERRLLEMVGRKEAALEGWPEVTTHDRVRAVSGIDRGATLPD